MIQVHATQAARDAVAANATRPATAIVHDAPGTRLVVFRIAPGQRVPPHRNAGHVQLTVLAGRGVLTGESDGAPIDVPCAAGDVVLYAPHELHAMRAESDELLLLATITTTITTRTTEIR